jgi:hypothetical protein
MDEDQKAFIDELKYGHSFMLNGKRIDPKDICMDKQKPVGYCRPIIINRPKDAHDCWTDLILGRPQYLYETPLFASPPKREWVSLTEDEQWEATKLSEPNPYSFARAVEAMLKERNHD